MLRSLLLLLCCSIVLSNIAISQDKIQVVENLSESINLKDNSLSTVYLDEDMIVSKLFSKAPEITLPYINGSKSFKVREFSIYGEAKNPYPEIKTFKIYSPSDPSLSGRITAGPAGVSIIYLKNGNMVRIYNPEPGADKSKRGYVREVGVAPSEKALHACATHDDFSIKPVKEEKPGFDNIPEGNELQKRNGSVKRVYRAAIICTGEYFQANGGGTTNIRQLMIANLNDISAIFEKDLAVEMVMATGAPRMESDPDNDPFDPSFGGRTSQAQSAVEGAFPISRYDVGHVFHNHQSGDGWDTGGIAGLGVVCNDARKASGWSGSFNNTTNGWIQLAAHEFGHMYDATHTFNGSGDANCTPNISSGTSYEIGSGSTLMSYQGLCDSEQNIPGSGVADNYFHINSLDRMVNYLENFGNCNESARILDNNNEPIADANPCGAEYVIPRATPFMLMGEASDADEDDVLTYCWEQYDEDGSGTPSIGLIGNDAGFFNGSCPLFRSLPPTSSPVRYFPNLSDLSNNTVSDFEALPRRNRLMKFRMTVRDNNPAGGAIDWDEISVAARNSGPLTVSSPSGGEVIQAGSTIEVIWDTNTRDNEIGICEKAVIKISTDGGLTFPYVVAEDIDYEAGTAMVDIPASFSNTEEARLMVACDDYECFAFFDINNGDFSIESNCLAPGNLLCDTKAEEYDFQDPGLNFDLTSLQGTVVTRLLDPIADDIGTLPTMQPVVNDNTGSCTRITSINNPFREIRFSVTESGTYVFNINNVLNDIVTAYTIFTEDFTPADACSSFIESNATFVGSYTYSTSFNVDLDECTEYVLVAQMTNSTSTNLALANITGPGSFVVQDANDDYDLTYVAIDAETNLIVQHNIDSDFRTLPVGEYEIYSAYYKARGATPPGFVDPDSWIGLTVNELLGGLDCFRTSINFKPVTVVQSCFLYDFEIGNQSPCIPETNTYSQTLSFSVDMGPGSGTVEVNGQTFPVSSDQVEITITDLIANSQPVDLEFFFSDNNGCDGVYEDVFVAPANCCPIDVDLGEDALYCDGEVIELDAGPDPIAYQWFKDGEELTETGRFLNVTEAGTYRVQVTHMTGCLNEDSVTLDFEALPEIVLDKSEVLACQGDLVVVNGSVSINDGTILWQKDGVDLPNTGTSIEVRESGTYELFVTTENNCSSSISFIADFAESPEVDLGPDILTCTGATTLLDSGVEGADYEWKRNGFTIPGDESTIEVNNFGTYSVVVTIPNGCIGLDTMIVDSEDLPEFDFGRDITRCFGNFYTIEAEVSAFEIQWYKDGELIENENEITYTAMESGVYVGQVRQNDQCIEGDTIEIEYLDIPNVDFPDLISACPGETIDLVIDDNMAVFTWFSLSTGVLPNTTNILSVTSADTYVVEARSTSTFCIVRDTVEVTFTDIPMLDLGADVVACNGETVLIGSPTNGFVAEWYKDGELIENETGEQLMVTEAGEYRMRVTSGMNCESEDFILVSFNASPIVDLGEELTSCPGETVTLDGGSIDNSFVWLKDGEELTESGNTLDVTETGFYTVIATNDINCSTEASVQVNFTELPIIELGEDIVRCEGDIYVFTLDPAGFDIEWYFNNELVTISSEEEFQAFQPGQYIALVNGGDNCIVSDTANVSYELFPEFDLGDDISACPGEIIKLEIEDMGYSFTWSGENQGVLATATNSIDITQTDMYYVEVSNDAGCITRDSIEINFVDLPILDLGEDQSICEGESITLTNVSNGFNIEWYKDGELITGEDTESILVTESGDYRMLVSASQDCSTEDVVTITVNPLPELDLGDDRSACPGDMVQLTGSFASFVHQWATESMGTLSVTDNMLTVTESDIYYVEVTSPENCISRDTIEINFTELPVIDLGTDIMDVCEGDVVMLNADAGTFDVEWLLEGEVIVGENNNTLDVMSSGNYTVVVSAGDNCSVEDQINVAFNPLPQIDAIEDQVACEGEELTLVAGVDGAFTYRWSDTMGLIQEGPMGSITVNTSETYTVEAIDANNCSNSESAVISFIAAPLVELDDSAEFCEGETIDIEAESNVTVVEWYKDGDVITGESGTILSVSEAGEYVAVVGPGTQCEDRDSITVSTIAAPSISYQGEFQICSDLLPYELSIVTESNTNIQWAENGTDIPGATSENLIISQAGNYSVRVVNSTNCTASEEFVIEVIDLPVNTLGQVPNLCEGETITVTADTDGQRFEWYKDGERIIGETDLELDISASGDYAFVSYNELDCASTTDFNVVVNMAPNVDLELSEIFVCGFDATHLYELEDVPGNSYVWYKDGVEIQGATSNTLEVSESGIYSVEVTNVAGCTDSDESQITIGVSPFLETPQLVTLCEGSSATIDIITDDNASIEWTFGSDVIASNTTSIEVSEPGVYEVLVGLTFCSQSSMIVVEEIPNPDIMVDDVELCPGEMQTLSLPSGFSSYTWTGVSATGAEADIDYLSVDTRTTEPASVTVIDQNGCTTTADFNIIYNPELNAQVLSESFSICEGESVQLQASGGVFYEWDDPNGTLSSTTVSDPVASPQDNTTYTVNVSDNCPDNFESIDIDVNVLASPDIDAGQDTCTILGADLMLTASGGVQYIWNNSDLIIGSTTNASVLINIEEDTVFTVTGIDENGCQNTDSINVCILEDPFQILNAVTLITPNGDFINDQLEFNGLEAFPLNKLTVFNRWGNVIFQKKGYQSDDIRWDGTRDGKPLPADTYYYILEFSEFKIKKSITLLRD